MKNNSSVSLLSSICVLMTVGFSGAYAAPSVRSFSGSGVYNGASSANSARSASLRSGYVSSGTLNKVRSDTASADTSADTSSGTVRSAINPYSSRLSVGKYLTSAESVSGGSSIRSQNPGVKSISTSTGGGDTTIIQNQVDELERRVDDLQTSDTNKYTIEQTDSLLDRKQDTLTAGDGIAIENGTISAVYVDGKKVLLQSDGTYIQWKYDDETSTWTNLVALADLTGPAGEQGPIGPQGEPGDSADLTGYSTTSEMDAAIIAAINNAAPDYATAAQGAKADTALQSADLSNYATVDALNTGLSVKANRADLGPLATKTAVETADITDANVTKPKLSADVQASLDKADTALQTADMSDYATTVDVNTALATKADSTTVDSALATKANTADLGALAAKDVVETADITDANITKPKLSADVQASLDKADTALQTADMSDYATTADVNTALADKADIATTYNKTEVDTTLATKADATTVDSALATKANTADLGALAAKDVVGTDDITDASVTKPKLAVDVQTSLVKADTALQPGDVPDTSDAPSDGTDYVMVVNNGTENWYKVAY